MKERNPRRILNNPALTTVGVGVAALAGFAAVATTSPETEQPPPRSISNYGNTITTPVATGYGFEIYKPPVGDQIFLISGLGLEGVAYIDEHCDVSSENDKDYELDLNKEENYVDVDDTKRIIKHVFVADTGCLTADASTPITTPTT